MKCTNPRRIPNLTVRALAVRKDDPRASAMREVPCRYCHACRQDARLNNADRLIGEIEVAEHESWFFTGTYDDENLPFTEHREPGELTEAQRKLFARWDRAEATGARTPDHELDWRNEMRDLAYTGSPRVPTCRYRDIQLWKKRVAKALGYTPRIVPAQEYGTGTDRPHVHALLVGVPMADAEIAFKAWDLGRIKDIFAADNNRVTRYATKDIAKGSHFAHRYICQGREPPRLVWPKNPYIGFYQEAWLLRTLQHIQTRLQPRAFEAELRSGTLGKYYRKGGQWRAVATTARKHVLDQLERDPTARLDAIEAEAQQAYEHVEKLDPDSVLFDPAYLDAHSKELNKRRAKSDRAKRAHRAIVARAKRKNRPL